MEFVRTADLGRVDEVKRGILRLFLALYATPFLERGDGCNLHRLSV